MEQDKIGNTQKTQLGYRQRDKLYQKEYAALKVKIALNCFELFAIFIVITIGVYFLITTIHSWTDLFPPVSISIISSLISTGIFFKIKKYQVSISRFDKEDIYKKISKDLLNSQ